LSLRGVRVPAWLIDVSLVCVAGVDSWYMATPSGPIDVTCAVVAALALIVRRRWPYLTLALTLPSVVVGSALLATPIALYTLARRTRSRWTLIGWVTVLVVGYATPSPTDPSAYDPSQLPIVGYGVAMLLAAVFLGQLVQARQDLSARIVEINESREHERELVGQTVLAAERAQLAREMHDVVSHQVSLIAVRAGALQVGASDPAVEDAAGVIRQLSVLTLDELRHMITLLRASGSVSGDIAPQPTLADLRQLIANSGVVTEFTGRPPDGVAAPAQRAIYRTVQESLTNVRKHAPGATATIEIWQDTDHFGLTITNTAPSRPAVALPSARHGLIGLRERAELLGGGVVAEPSADGGFQVRLRLPLAHPIPS
jgi:signal transduction histidine kinase